MDALLSRQWAAACGVIIETRTRSFVLTVTVTRHSHWYGGGLGGGECDAD